MLDWSRCAAVNRSPDKVNGEWLFKGTRIPVRTLFGNIQDGASIDGFIAGIPGAAREQAKLALRHAEQHR